MGADSEALTGEEDLEAIEDGLKEKGVFPEITPMAISQSLDWFKPDDEAYEPLEENAIKGFLLKTEAGEAELEVHGFTESGVPYCAHLTKEQVKEGFSQRPLGDILREHFRELHESESLIDRGTLTHLIREGHRIKEDDKEFREEYNGPNDWFGTSGEQLGGYDGTHEFLPLGNSPFNRQLYLHDQWDMQTKAFYARTHDPVAKRALTLIVDFVLGRSVKMVAASPIVQEYLEKFDKLNGITRKLPIWVEDQGCDGELFFRFFETEGNRPPKMVTLDPSSIWEIITDPENIEDVKFYWQQYETAYQMIGSAPASNTDIPAPDRRNPIVKYIIRYIPADKVLHFKINASAVEKRGRSDLFPVLGWLQRLRKYYDAETIKSLMQAAFVFDILLKGGATNAASVKSFSAQVPPPDVTKFGSVFYRNEAVEIQLLQGNKSAVNNTGSIGIGDGLLGIIAIGLGFAKDYLGVTSRGSRATALVSTEPSAKHFERRQREVKFMLEDICAYAIQYGIDHKILPLTERIIVKRQWRKVVSLLFTSIRKFKFSDALEIIRLAAQGSIERPLDRNVAFIFPDIVKSDRTALIGDVKEAEGMNWISKRRAADLIAAAFEFDDWNYDEEQQDIVEEGETVIAKDEEQVRKGPPDANDPGMAPGTVAKPSATPAKPTPPSGKESLADRSSLSRNSDDNNGGGARGEDNPSGDGGDDIRKDLGVQAREASKAITIKII